jgi:hypothetical protein
MYVITPAERSQILNYSQTCTCRDHFVFSDILFRIVLFCSKVLSFLLKYVLRHSREKTVSISQLPSFFFLLQQSAACWAVKENTKSSASLGLLHERNTGLDSMCFVFNRWLAWKSLDFSLSWYPTDANCRSESGLCSEFSTAAAQIWETEDGVRCSKAKCVTRVPEEALDQRAIYAKQERWFRCIQMAGPKCRRWWVVMWFGKPLLWSANLRIGAPWTMGEWDLGGIRDKWSFLGLLQWGSRPLVGCSLMQDRRWKDI